MNLVAHQLLSFNNPEWQIGNHLGEVVKGKNYDQYSSEIAKGIKLHRFIDSFTDSNDIVKKSTLKFHSKYKKYSPVLIDIFYDYFLIKNWEKYAETDFLNFKNSVYKLLGSHTHIYPKKLAISTNAMIKHDWLEKYTTLDGIEITLKNLSKKTTFVNNMHMAVKDLYIQEESLNKEFNLFFPTIIDACKNFLELN